MVSPDTYSSAVTNRSARLSFAAGVLTLISLCAALVPVPLTGFVCFPAAAIFGAVAAVAGITALRQIRARNEKGRVLARVGLGIGGFAIATAACLAAIGIAYGPRLWESIRTLAQ